LLRGEAGQCGQILREEFSLGHEGTIYKHLNLNPILIIGIQSIKIEIKTESYF